MSQTLLALFAHLDDEGFGTGSTVAHYASDGTCVTLVCTTRGEVGEIAEGTGATPGNALGKVREGELRCAAETMGISELIFLGWLPRTEGWLTRPKTLIHAPTSMRPPKMWSLGWSASSVACSRRSS